MYLNGESQCWVLFKCCLILTSRHYLVPTLSLCQESILALLLIGPTYFYVHFIPESTGLPCRSIITVYLAKSSNIQTLHALLHTSLEPVTYRTIVCHHMIYIFNTVVDVQECYRVPCYAFLLCKSTMYQKKQFITSTILVLYLCL